ncbi:hypothetical protein PR048_020039 [Dryococelus australis]|uniref:Uncharacterized protein n=1 Tax=Dryococelus australis TaxID=614101 RepID=A0ABQ9H575_9NEOP|nr:hypothetical protein PR048_020039 [Dryococelus australis]
MLLTGPKLQMDISENLLQFHSLESEHQDYQRIVWLNSLHEPIRDYRLYAVTNGVSSALYLVIHTLKQLAEDEQHRFPKAAHILQTDVYIDDVTWTASVAEAIALQK